MILKRVQYQHFRNIKDATLSFSPGVNLLYGDNAQGKTNAIEGIYLCAQGRSHRTAREKDYILYGEEFAKVTLDYADGVREDRQLELRYLKTGRKFCKKNGIHVKKMSEFIGNFRAVIFCPEYLSIVRDGPGERRAFLDGALCQLDSSYLYALQKCAAALAQRNKLLAEYPHNPTAFEETGDLWAEQIAEMSELLSNKRAEYIEKVQSEVKTLFFEMTGGGETPELIYKKPMKKEEYLEQFSSGKQREIRAGTTLFGVHRDDIEILLNGKQARIFASQGQQRSLAVAMKLAEGSISKERTGEYPVFLLDDVLSELDDKRKRFILSGLSGRQVIITCCDEKEVEKVADGRVLKVEKGQYTAVR